MCGELLAQAVGGAQAYPPQPVAENGVVSSVIAQGMWGGTWAVGPEVSDSGAIPPSAGGRDG